jgi:hypothetical protein
VRLARISGVVVDSQGKPANAHAVLLSAGAITMARFFSAEPVAETDAAGRFTLENVAPNEYRLDVRAAAYFEAVAQGGRVGQMQRADALEFASVPLTVTGEDLAGFSVRLTAGHQMTGRVIVEGAEPDPRMLDALSVSVMAWERRVCGGCSPLTGLLPLTARSGSGA